MDVLDEFAARARTTLQRGYYDMMGAPTLPQSPSLADAVRSRPRAVIAELKPASPSEGPLRSHAAGTAEALVKAGARALSVLTEPDMFAGSLQTLRDASRLGVPTMMKDFVLAEPQLACARRCGARAVLLIATLHARGRADLPLGDMVELAHRHGLEALVEVASAKDFRDAQATRADLIGINNRDLRTLAMDLGRTPRILGEVAKDRPVVGLSGVHARGEADALFAAGCDAILVGSSLMKAPDPAGKLREFL